MTRITLARIGKHPTVRYAVEEMVRYLKQIDIELMIDVRLYDAYDPTVGGVIWVGEDPAFDSLLLPVEDRRLDDAIYIGIKKMLSSHPSKLGICGNRIKGSSFMGQKTGGEIFRDVTVYFKH